MKILGTVEPREVEGADTSLDGYLIECRSGNQCCVYPALTYDAGANQTRIAFFTGWHDRRSVLWAIVSRDLTILYE